MNDNLVFITECVARVNENVLSKLACDERINIYIALTGILVAIIIFIAEIMSNYKNELYKKLILKNTELEDNIIIMMEVLIIIWASNLINIKEVLLYVSVQIVIDSLIIYSMIKTTKIFYIAIRLNIETEYFDEQLDNYIKRELLKINKINHRVKRKNIKNSKIFEEFILKSNLYKQDTNVMDINEEYKKIYPDANFYIGNYNYNLLKQIEKRSDSISINSNEIKESKIKNGRLQSSEIILCKNIGDKINKRYPIAYYKNIDEQLANRLKQTMLEDTNKKYAMQNIIKIVEGLFKIAKEDEKNYDGTNQLLNFYDFLCKNNYEDVRQIFMNNLEVEIKEIRNNNRYEESFSDFLVRLLINSFKNDKYEDFSLINSNIISLFYLHMQVEEVDLKRIAYEYANHVFLNFFYIIKKEKDLMYYDNLMSNLLTLINQFVKMKSIEAVEVLFDNIHFSEMSNQTNQELNKYEILNFHFMIGIISSILYFYDNLTDSNFEEIKKLIEKIENKFVGFMDIWETIVSFNKYQKTESEIKHKVKFFDFYNVEHEYKNSWMSSPINEYEVLNCILYMCKIYYYNDENIDPNDINKEDKFYFEGVLHVLHNNTYDKLKKVFGAGEKYVSRVEVVLKKAISIAEEKEEIHKRESELEQAKIEEFKKRILEKSKERTGIIAVLYNLNKVKFSEKKLKKVFGFNQIIPRDIFFNDVGGIETIADSYANAFTNGINEKITEWVESKSQYVNETLEERLKKIKNIKDYIIIINSHDFYTNKLFKNNREMIFNGERLEIIKTQDVDRIVIINKKSLPEIEYCKFIDDYEEENTFGNMYYKLEDCSDNIELVNKIISNADWIKENRTEEEQINFVRQHCRLQAFISYRMIFPKKVESFIVKSS